MVPIRFQGRVRDVPSRGRPRPNFADDGYLAYLEANSHLGEVREAIRDGIRRGLIRVSPVRGNPERVRVIRARGEPPPA